MSAAAICKPSSAHTPWRQTVLKNLLSEYIRACFTGIWIESHEHEDALAEIGQLCHEEQWQLATWDIDEGLCLGGQSSNGDGGQDRSAGGRFRCPWSNCPERSAW
jgi:hypothetical protein